LSHPVEFELLVYSSSEGLVEVAYQFVNPNAKNTGSYDLLNIQQSETWENNNSEKSSPKVSHCFFIITALLI